jgi:hypothetical protein
MYRYSKSTALNGIVMARAYEDALTSAEGNTYVGLGQVESSWGKPVVKESIESFSEAFNNLVVLQKITSSDINLVVPDSLWVTSTAYDQYDSNNEMYLHETVTQVAGTITYTSGSDYILGTSTTFNVDFSVGDVIQIDGVGTENSFLRREIVDVIDSGNVRINTTFASSYSEQYAYKVEDVYPSYGKSFYVRNSYDQVFLCIFNNGNSLSTVEPILRPENFSMNKMVQSTTDGYIWRYLYTIPSGLKAKFLFTDNDSNAWMPVTTDAIVAATAVNGAIEHIRILDGGTRYNSNTANQSADIITISGDGTNASYVANVQVSGDATTIVSLLSANNGSDYSYAEITSSDLTGNGASFSALISPAGGFGKDPAKDLGAKFLAVSVEFDSTVSGTFPISSTAGTMAFRQVSIIRNPQYANGSYITASAVATSANLEVSVSSTPTIGSRVEQTDGYSGTVVAFNSPYLLLNNTRGTFANTGPFSSGVIGNAQSLEAPEVKRSGDVLYLENITSISRDTNQAEQIKLVFKF